MDWVHGRSRVTSGASRLHHLAGVTQVAPGAPPTSGKASWPNSPRQGCWLASGSSSSREGQISPLWAPPSQWRDPPALGSGGGTPWGVPIGTPWGVPWDSRTTHFPRPRASTYRENRLWGLKEHLVIPSQNCSPLSWIPLLLLHPEWGSKSVKKEWQEPHFFASYWRKGRGLHLRHS